MTPRKSMCSDSALRPRVPTFAALVTPKVLVTHAEATRTKEASARILRKDAPPRLVALLNRLCLGRWGPLDLKSTPPCRKEFSASSATCLLAPRHKRGCTSAQATGLPRPSTWAAKSKVAAAATSGGIESSSSPPAAAADCRPAASTGSKVLASDKAQHGRVGEAAACPLVQHPARRGNGATSERSVTDGTRPAARRPQSGISSCEPNNRLCCPDGQLCASTLCEEARRCRASTRSAGVNQNFEP